MLRSSNATPNVDSQRTANPIVTGGSVVGVKYNGGILVAADTLASYGSLARFEGVERIAQIGDAGDTLLAAGGEYSDYQYMLRDRGQGRGVCDGRRRDDEPEELHHGSRASCTTGARNGSALEQVKAPELVAAAAPAPPRPPLRDRRTPRRPAPSSDVFHRLTLAA